MKLTPVVFFFIVIGVFSTLLGAEPSVILTPPKLQSGMTAIEELLAVASARYSDEILTLVEDTLDKPQFMEGFGNAAARSVLVPTGLHHSATPVLILGSAAGLFADTLSPSLIQDLSNLEPEDDRKMGLCIQPLVVSALFPLERFKKGLFGGASLGFMDLEAQEYGVWAFSAGLSGGYTFLSAPEGMVRWEGVTLGSGADFAINRLTAQIRPGTIEEDVPLDPDGPGPLIAQEATLIIDPDIRAGVESTVWTFRLQATTGITFFETLHLFTGGGVSAGLASAGITIEADEEIEVQGYLNNLIEESGRVRISGTTALHSNLVITGFLTGGIGYRVGPFSLSVPIVWSPNNGLGTGCFLGVRW